VKKGNLFRVNQLSIGPNKGVVQPSRTILLKLAVSRGTEGCGKALPSNGILETRFASTYCSVYTSVLKVQIVAVINISGTTISMLSFYYKACAKYARLLHFRKNAGFS
jgi:hypothetical protein